MTIRKVKRLSVLLVILVFTTCIPAYADEVDDQINQMNLRYGSVSSAMIDSYAHKQGKALTSFLIGNPGQLANLTGVSLDDPRIQGLVSQLGTSASAYDLDLALANNGLTLSSNAYTSISNATAEINAKAKTLDASIVQAGIAWTNNMTSLLAPSLSVPATPQLDTSAVTGLPSEGLVFGMFTNRALNAFVRQYPDIFSQVTASGVGTPEQMTSWNNSIKIAMKASKSDFSKMLPSACADAFLSGMVGGVSVTGKCSPCSIAGSVANSQLQLIFSPKAVSPGSVTLSPTDLANLSPAQKSALASQNGTLSEILDGNSGSGCGALSSSIQDNVSATLPSVLNYLGGK